MERLLTKQELEAQLDGKTGEIKRRIDALQYEVATTGSAIREALMKNPLLGVGGALLGGVVVGLMVGRKKTPQDPYDLGPAHHALVDRYMDALIDELRFAVASGEEEGDALRQALRDRMPLIVFTPSTTAQTMGILRQMLDLTLKTALGFAVKAAIDYFTQKYDPLALLVEEEALEQERENAAAMHSMPSGPVEEGS